MACSLKIGIQSAQISVDILESCKNSSFYVSVRFKHEYFKTAVINHTSCAPVWETEIIIQQISKSDLYNELLLLRVFQVELNSSHSKIGKVNLSLIPLLKLENNIIFDGFMPISSSQEGIRGYIRLKIQLEEVANSMSCNISMVSQQHASLYSTNSIPNGYQLEHIHGTVYDHLLCDEESRKRILNIIRVKYSISGSQKTFLKLSNRIQANIIQMALELGGNAVIGYKQFYIIQKETGPYFRACGTVVTINPIPKPVNNKIQANINKTNFKYIPDLFISLSGNSQNIAIQAVQIITINTIPLSYLTFIGQFVTAYSTQILPKQDDEEFFDEIHQHWNQLRHEIKLHAFSLGCNFIFGYHESMQVFDDFLLLQVSGTAVYVRTDAYDDKINPNPCSLLHTPKHIMEISCICQYCGCESLPSAFYSTLQPQHDLPLSSDGENISAFVVKKIRNDKHDDVADNLARLIPYIEKDLMDKFSEKMLTANCNSVFGITTNVSFNSGVVVFSRHGTAYLLGPFLSIDNQQCSNLPQSNILDSLKISSSLSHRYIQMPALSHSPNNNSTIQQIYKTNKTNKTHKTQETFFTYVIGTKVKDSQTLDTFFGNIMNMLSLDSLDESHLNVKHCIDDKILHIITTTTRMVDKNDIQQQSLEYWKLTSLETDDPIEWDIKLSESDDDCTTNNINLGYINFYLHKGPFDIKEEEGYLNFPIIFLNESLHSFKCYAKCIGGDTISSFKIDEFKIKNFQKQSQVESWICISGNVIKNNDYVD